MSDWVIHVAGYGTFMFEGTHAQAEEMRAHKANWERGIGKLRPATNDEVVTRKPSECLNHPGFQNKFKYADCECSACTSACGETPK